MLLILGFTLITSCKKNEEPELSEVEIWKLSWRMIEINFQNELTISFYCLT